MDEKITQNITFCIKSLEKTIKKSPEGVVKKMTT